VNQAFRRLCVVVSAIALIAASILPAGAGGKATDAPAAARPETDYVMVRLADSPMASYMGTIPGLERTKPLPGQKLNPGSSAARAYGRYLNDRRQNYKGWLQSNAPRAQIVREYSVVFNGFAIKLNGERLEHLATGTGATRVSRSFLVRPTMTVSLGLIDADDVWPSAGGRENAGSGIKIGVIDTGIRDDHAAFGCKGTIPHDVFASGEALPPNDRKVIVFNHGTHVAGTAAGCILDLSGPEDGPTLGTWSGVAPGASLHDYNVFPGFGAGFRAFGGSAFSHDIAAALEKSVADGMDVVNLSIGGGVQGPHDLLAEALDATVDAGVVAAVAAGNSGPGGSTVESPGSAAGALTAGASTNPHFVGIPLTATPTKGTPQSLTGATGDFAIFGALTANYTVTTPANGCSTITTSLTGKVALIDRGVCTFTTKVRNAQNAGAAGVLIVNNVAGDPIGMAQDGSTPVPTVPAVMLSKSNGNAIKPAGSVVFTGAAPTEFITTNADIIAGFSSRGPTPFTYLIKPDVTAPGVNVYSSVFNEQDPEELGFAYFQGTSMATPHLAGAAALLLDLHPGWSPADVKSALVSTAKRPVWDHVTGAAATGVLTRGGGRIDLDAADATPVTSDPASASFGFWGGNKDVSAALNLILRDKEGAAQTCGVAVTGNPTGNTILTAPSSVSIAANGTATLTLTLAAGKSSQTGGGDRSGDVVLTCGSTTLLVPWWVRIDREAKP
jgi:minor extracellular serine protease Vpr